MSKEAMLPCLVCGKTLPNAFPDADNQPYGGTEFRTYGAYGSTFWDSFDGEELVLNICDDCLRAHTERLAQHKRFRPVMSYQGSTGLPLMVGKHWVDRPMVGYTGNTDDGTVKIEPEEIGQLPNIEWPNNVAELRAYALREEE
jgi:hypothetical protein